MNIFPCTVGFDSEHMSEGADPKMNFKDYVLGNLDGLQRPLWAIWALRVERSRVPIPNNERIFANEHWRAILTGKYTAGKGPKKI